MLLRESGTTVNQTYIVCDREPISLADMVATLRKAAGRPPTARFGPDHVSSRTSFCWWGGQHFGIEWPENWWQSSAKLQGAGWLPPIETKAGLSAMMKATLTFDRAN